MKVPRSFSISGVSDMASLRVGEVRWCGFGAFKRESALGLFWQPHGQPARTSAAGGEPPRPATPCAHNAGRLREPRLP